MAAAHRALGALALLLALVAPAAANDPSPVVFPDQHLSIKFSHKQHVVLKIDCDFCHENAPGSVSASDNLMPVEDACSSCHKIDRDSPNKVAKPAASCDICHYYERDPRRGVPDSPDALRSGSVNLAAWNEPLRVDIPTPNLKFNHKVHADRDIKCERCHGTLRDTTLATRDNLPTMPLCLGCHNNLPISHAPEQKVGSAPANCTTCHISQADSTLQTQFATGRMVPSGIIKGDAHTVDFATRHASLGRDQSRYCENCHRKDFCLACHNGVVKPLAFHGNDYLRIHPIEAQKASLNCDGCHRRQTFCLGCHERTGVTDTVTNNGPNNISRYLDKAGKPVRFHPPFAQFVSAPRTPEHHSWQAERNLKACISCHREESCIECHATTNVKVKGESELYSVRRFVNISPHPPNFASSQTCSSIARRNGRVCLKCHTPDDPQLSCR